MNFSYPYAKAFFIFAFAYIISFTSFAQCQFSISRTTSSDHCIYATEDVVWNKSTKANVLITTNSLTKNAGGNGASDAGAASVNAVKMNGWATAVVNELNTARIFGLSATGPHLNAMSSIQYGFQLRQDNSIDIIEGTTYTFTGIPIVSGAVLKIWNDRGTIKFYVNSTLIRVSSVAPPASLVVDAILQTSGSTLTNVKVTNGTDGSFTASSPAGDLGTGVKYEWFKNSISTGAASAGNFNYTNTALVDGDVITCQLTQTGGCAAAVTSNSISIKIESPSLFGDYYLLNNEVAFACLEAAEQITVFDFKSNVLVNGNNLTKVLAPDGSFNSGAQSVATVANNGYAQATINETNTLRTFGLASPGNDNSYTSVKYGFYIRGDAKLQAIDQGTLKTITGNDTYVSGEILKIQIDNNVVKYYRGSTGTTLAYISNTAPVFPLRADVAFNSINATINNVIIGNGSAGSFNITASPSISAAIYDWKLNGAPAPGATNSMSYTNTTSLVNGDALVCIIKPGQVGCSMTTPPVTISGRSYGGDFYINNAASTIACAEMVEEVKFTNLVGATANANTVTKFQGGDGQWNAGATSLNKIYNNGYAEFDIKQTNLSQLFGITSNGATPSNPNDASVQFGFVFYANGTYLIMESGNIRTGYTAYAINNVFRIKIDNNQIKYYQIAGGVATLIYTSAATTATIAAAIPYVVDVSLNTQSSPLFAEISNVRVSNGSNGIFVANASSVGASPTYQWKVNGINVAGATTATYSNASLVLSDQVSCTIVPDIAGCAVPYNSNLIKVTLVGGPASPVSNWTGNAVPVSTAWDNSGNWDNGIPNGYTKAFIPNGRPRYPSVSSAAGVYDITIASSASLSVTGANSFTVFNQFDNQGTFNAASGMVNLITCTNNKNVIKAPAGGNTFYDLNISNANHVDAYANHSINHELKLQSGVVTMMNTSDRIIIKSGATVSGASSASFIDGKVTKIGNVSAEFPFDFPIGDAGVYRKLTISRPSVVTDNFTAQYFKASAASLATRTDPTFYTISGCEYWQLLRTGGTSDVQVTLSWNSADCPDPTYITTPSLSFLRVARLDDSDPSPANYIWENKGNTSTTGNAASGTIASINGVGGYGYFTLASLSSGNTLPVELKTFKADKVLNAVQLSWTTSSEYKNDYFEVQRSGDGKEFVNLGQIKANGSTKYETHYEFIDRNAKDGKNYYRLRLVDLDKTTTYSKVVKVDFNSGGSSTFYPNPVKRGEMLHVFSEKSEFIFIDVFYNRILKSVNPDGTIDTSDLIPGVYLTGDGTQFRKLVVY